MNNRLDIPIQPPVRVKTENIEADATPVPEWKKKLREEIKKNERSNVSAEAE